MPASFTPFSRLSATVTILFIPDISISLFTASDAPYMITFPPSAVTVLYRPIITPIPDESIKVTFSKLNATLTAPVLPSSLSAFSLTDDALCWSSSPKIYSIFSSSSIKMLSFYISIICNKFPLLNFDNLCRKHFLLFLNCDIIKQT